MLSSGHISSEVIKRNLYDFEEGGLAFLKPKQIVYSPEEIQNYEGIALYFHSGFIRNYPLGNTISQYGFFFYDVSEALFLSAKEKETIANESDNNIDSVSQDVLVSQIELLLNYSKKIVAVPRFIYFR